METIFVDPFFINVILPFLLIFVVVFAILKKTQVLGDNKGVDLIVSLVLSFLFVTVPYAVGFTQKFIPIVSVFIVIILGFYLIFGFLGLHTARGLLITLGILFGLAFIGALLWVTGLWDKIKVNSSIIGTIIMIIVLGGAIALVVVLSGKTK
jgi:hypothetical protein